MKSESVVERDHVITLPMHYEHGAHGMPQVAVIGVEVQALVHTRRTTTTVRIWIYHLDTREKRRMKDQSTKWFARET
jgi:hypothetical protein